MQMPKKPTFRGLLLLRAASASVFKLSKLDFLHPTPLQAFHSGWPVFN
jgi:hypothetical protein